MKNRRPIALIALLLTVIVAVSVVSSADRSSRAGAFGSVDSSIIGQTATHERITRTLACAASDPVETCFQNISISVLAGRDGTFGAVGEPDNPLDGSPNPSARHCDNIDSGYDSPNSIAAAQKAFNECLDWYQSYMDFAVNSAGALLKADGTIDPAQTDLINFFGSTYNSCKFPDPKKGNTSNDSAKCNVLNGLGRALHNYEDIWSHSNWGDYADRSKAVELTNPRGLANTEQPAFMAYPGPRSLPLPDGFLSGCDDSLPLNDCVVGFADSTDVITWRYRTAHSMVNKDNGSLDAKTCVGVSPKSTRGKVVVDGVSNYARATKGACAAARRAWSDLQAALVAKYGQQRAATMVRALTYDHPLTDCSVSGSAAKAEAPPVGDRSSTRSVTIFVVNKTSKQLSCGDAVLDGGEWASYPSDSIAPGATARWRTQSDGLATGTEGRATFRFDGTGVFTVNWDNPYWGSNSYSCAAPAGYTCTRTGGDGNDSTITVTFSGP